MLQDALSFENEALMVSGLRALSFARQLPCLLRLFFVVSMATDKSNKESIKEGK